jgi:hypothetical protein
MTIVKCGGCGENINIDSKHSYAQILKHRLSCKSYEWPDSEQIMARAIGNYLSRKLRG